MNITIYKAEKSINYLRNLEDRCKKKKIFNNYILIKILYRNLI